MIGEALTFVETMFSWFGKHTLESFAGLLLKALGKDKFCREDREAKLTFPRPRYVLGGAFIDTSV